MQATKTSFRDVQHRPRLKKWQMSLRAAKRYEREAQESLMASEYRRLCQMEAGR